MLKKRSRLIRLVAVCTQNERALHRTKGRGWDGSSEKPFRNTDNDVALGGLSGELLKVLSGGSLLHLPVEIESASVRAACVCLSSGGKLSIGMRAPEQESGDGIVRVFVQGKIVQKRPNAHDENFTGAKSAERNANPLLRNVRLKCRQ
jgi:hypothetical protein